MTAAHQTPGPEQPAPGRILEAAVRCIAETGVDGASLQAIAARAGVSKALLLYHFRDKDTLLTRLVERLAERLVARERPLLRDATPATAIDALWRWVEAELARGELRVLVAVADHPAPAVRAAARTAAHARRTQSAQTVARLFAALQLTPRIPAELLAEVVVAFLDGLAVEHALHPERVPRVAFDVLWLALLSLAE